MNELESKSNSYKNWLTELSANYRNSQIKAAMKVNDEMLRFYWKLGKDMEVLKEEVKWGSHFYKKVSDDLKKILPDVKSFSPRNLLYMNQFYRLFPDIEITQQVVSQIGDNEIEQQAVSQMDSTIQCLFLIPWGHLV